MLSASLVLSATLMVNGGDSTSPKALANGLTVGGAVGLLPAGVAMIVVSGQRHSPGLSGPGRTGLYAAGAGTAVLGIGMMAAGMTLVGQRVGSEDGSQGKLRTRGIINLSLAGVGAGLAIGLAQAVALQGDTRQGMFVGASVGASLAFFGALGGGLLLGQSMAPRGDSGLSAARGFTLQYSGRF